MMEYQYFTIELTQGRTEKTSFQQRKRNGFQPKAKKVGNITFNRVSKQRNNFASFFRRNNLGYYKWR